MKHLKYFKESVSTNHNIDTILDNYLECALWTSEEQGDEFEDKNINDFSEESKKIAKSEINWFITIAENELGDSFDDISDDMIGHDLWLTRNGHGAGFWDRGYDKKTEELLVELSKELGFTDIYVGDDDLIYLSGKDRYKDFDLEQYKLDKKAKQYNL